MSNPLQALIPLQEEFSDLDGRFLDYAAYDSGQLSALYKQQHVDIRVFQNSAIQVPKTMLWFDQQTAFSLDGQTMTTLEGNIDWRSGEGWTAGSVGLQADRNHWRGISLTCSSTGVTSTQSVIAPSLYSPNVEIVDISTGFSTGNDLYPASTLDPSSSLFMSDSGFLILSLPAFPSGSMDLTQSFLDLTSNLSGSTVNFTTGPTASIPFSSFVQTNIGSDVELRISKDILHTLAPTLNLSAISGVRFRIYATSAPITFRCLAIRLVGSFWKWAPIDTDTRYDTAYAVPSRTGSLTETVGFPAATQTGTVTTDWPILFKADVPPSDSDPRPIDLDFTAGFNTGSITSPTGGKFNEISFYLRELSLAYITQLNLNGTTQATLDALGHQPDFGYAQWTGRLQSDIDGSTQNVLDLDTQFQLERKQNYLQAAFLTIRLRWTTTNVELAIYDSVTIASPPYLFNTANNGLALTANKDYILIASLEENGIRARIAPLDSQGNILFKNLVFDTTLIDDPSLNRRRQGRFGWYAHFVDGDAKLYNIRPSEVNFSEYRSHPLNSVTPVRGARLHTQQTVAPEQVTNVFAGPWGGVVNVDSIKSHSGNSFSVLTDGTKPLQGAQTNKVYFDDFAQTDIEFKVLFPKQAISGNSGLAAFLYGETGRVVQLTIPALKGDIWETIRIVPDGQLVQTGVYNLVLVRTTYGSSVTWYLDQVSVKRRTVAWEARPEPDDAWKTKTVDWTPFDNTVNQFQSGVALSPGKQLQVRAKALQQDVEVAHIKIQPAYAELGRLIWKDEELDGLTAPTASFSLVKSGQTVTVTDTSTPSGAFLISQEWTFGDGSDGFGPKASHPYLVPGTYTITLLVTDNHQQQAFSTQAVTIP